MAAHKTSAVADEPIHVLFALHPKFDLLDLSGPLKVFTTALHDAKDPTSRAFEVTLAGGEPQVLSDQDVMVGSQISFKDAHERIEDFDVLAILGGNVDEILDKEQEPLGLINDFAELQKKDPARERTLFSVCTGSLLLARENILSGLSATTHPDYLTKFENVCSDAATRNLTERTDVVEDTRYVVNNLRFDLGEEDENPYVRRKSEGGRRPSNARKGSMSLKGSNSRRESIARRAAMRLGGLRVITSGGASAGIDAALYLVSALVEDECAAEVARLMQWTWNKGVVVDGLDV
ncbi:uncharacterized protein UV8b_04908 [Ustilaginoidea virens]|uniref:DJ-1/PfpI domain-containing protein n=1 Tax=Ustilaginoidea virens TaxID=1159556 RepID=A0A8E5HSG7_USTVR|nr:uncharacterized protein UV8b_04908 [Ustilaginoidea virens]QUC20667.1 hypothetical protein UV8b_04908 [Ustilaginoidea virens]